MAKLTKIKGDASFRTFFRKKNAQQSSIIVIAKKEKFKKYLNLYVENNIVYVSDNIGYLYAYDFYKNKIIWAKNYKIPFRGNLKIFENKLIATNQNNSLFFY